MQNKNESFQILLIESELIAAGEDPKRLDGLLRSTGRRLIHCATPQAAFDALARRCCSLVCVGSGETARWIRDHLRGPARNTPFLWFLRQIDSDKIREAEALGNTDLILTPAHNETVLRRVAGFEQLEDRKLRDLVEGINHTLIWSADPETLQFTYVSPRAEWLTGYPVEQWQNEPGFFLRHVPPEDQKKVAEAFKQAQEGDDLSFEHRFLRADGSEIWFHTGVRLARLGEGAGHELRGVSADVTRLQRASQEVAQGEERLHVALTTGNIGLWDWNVRSDELYLSETLLDDWGIDRRRVPSTLADCAGHIHAEDRARTLAEIQLAVQAGRTYDMEYRVVRATGEVIWIHSRGRCFVDDQGKPVRLAGVSINVTEAKRQQEQLEESEFQFRTLAESIPQMAWMAHPDGHVYWYNRRWYQYTGLSSDDMQGLNWQRVHDPHELPRLMAVWKKALETKKPLTIECPIRGADGKFRWFLTKSTPLKNSRGEVFRWIGTATDIHEQRRNREALELLSEASAVLSSSLEYNETFRRLAQITVPRLADWCTLDVLEDSGPRTVAIVHPDPARMKVADELRERFPQDWSGGTGRPQVLRTGRSEIFPTVTDEQLREVARDEHHYELLRALGMRSVMMVPIEARGKTLGVLTLISTREDWRYTAYELSVAEELGRRAGIALDNARLYQASQDAIQARDEFLSIASHELKTPLTSLQLQTQLQRRALDRGNTSFFSPELFRRRIDQTERQLFRLTRLVNDMLDVARIRTGKLSLERERCDLCEVLTEAIARLRLQYADSGCALPVLLHCAGAEGEWDRVRIEQVVINLLTNAIRYGNKRPITVGVTSEGDYVRFEVRDQGIGISEESRERIFNRFERGVSPNEVSGLGLGLFITRQIVQAHGGRIWVESQLGQGSTFIVELPRRAVQDRSGLAIDLPPLDKDFKTG